MGHVLLVDDDTVSRTVLRIMLERLDLAVVEADSVATASGHLETTDVDLIICDYEMPDANGLDLLAAFPDLSDRFVLVTGTTERSKLDDARVENVAAYLTKPVGSDELRGLLRTMLGVPLAS